MARPFSARLSRLGLVAALVVAGALAFGIGRPSSSSAASQQAGAGPAAASSDADGVTLTVHAANDLFDTDTLSAPSGALVTVNFFNDDPGEDHHLEFGGSDAFPIRDLCRGPCTDSYTFTAPAPGVYNFHCVVHDGMIGRFVVN